MIPDRKMVELYGIHPSATIHPLAHVDGSWIGPRTRVWQFASVIRGTILGADCNVASCATLDGPRFGDRCIISQGVAMGPGFLIGNDVFIGPNVTVCNDMWPAVNKNGFDIAALQSGKWVVIIDDGACIGANAVVLPGVHIGSGAVIAAGAVVSRSVPPNRLYRRDGTIKIISDASRERRIREVTC